jgi:tetratricopeptide (TPR) repeat protein
LYAAALRGENVDGKTPAELWEALIEDDRQFTQQDQSDESSLEILITMHRLLGDFHILHDDQALAFEARQKVNDSVFGDDEEVVQWMDWLLRRSAWSAVVDLAEKNERRFEHQAMLLYGLAEAQLRLGQDPSSVEATARRANAAAPLDEDFERYRTAVYLEDERGLFDWAEREYRHIIAHVGPESIVRASCFYRLGEMLHGEDRGADAHQALSDLLKEIEESEIVRRVVQEQWGRDLPALRARMNLYMACHFRDRGDTAKQREYLERAIQYDPTEVDVLIAMYRVQDAGDTWRKKTIRLINNAREQSRQDISDARRAAEGTGDEKDEDLSLSGALNQLAWLVSNTEGDYAEALRMSKNSLQLEPGDAGILDTLGRCYYSLKDYENAVKYQRWALQRSPHEGHIRQQLKLFEAALAESHR